MTDGFPAFCCPETHQSLRPADTALVAVLESRRQSGELTDRQGKGVKKPIEDGLVREDGSVFYPVRQGVPVLLVEDSISLDDGESGATSGASKVEEASEEDPDRGEDAPPIGGEAGRDE